MSACFCCTLIRPSPPIKESYFPWLTTSPNPPSFPLILRKGAHFSHRIFARVLQQGLGVVSTDDVLLETPAVDDAREEDKEDVHRVLDGAADSNSKHKALKSSSTRVKKKDEKEDGSDRFKLRNGREVFEEKAYLVGVDRKGDIEDSFGIQDSLKELAQLADTAGLMVVGTTYQKLASPNPRTYIGSGKVAEIKSAIHALDVETVIFDDELSPGQLRNLEKAFGGDVRVCDRTALILDIFNQRAATHEAALQVALAQMEYQLPRLTKMWTHLERQAGGQVKGMGEKQIEVDKRILRTQIGGLKKELESVRKHRKQYRSRRLSVPVPVVSLVGYTNAGKSTLLNQLTGANVLAEDRLFATLDPTTRRVQMKNGKDFLLTDTVGFIQKLPTALVAAFRATLEEISESSLLVHVVDISHPLAQQQIDAVDKVLSELDVSSIPKLMVWNKVDKEKLKVLCQELLSTIHQVGMVERTCKLGYIHDLNSPNLCNLHLNSSSTSEMLVHVYRLPVKDETRIRNTQKMGHWSRHMFPKVRKATHTNEATVCNMITVEDSVLAHRGEDGERRGSGFMTSEDLDVEGYILYEFVSGAVFRATLVIVAITLFSAALTLAHPGFNFGWGGHGGGGISGGSFGLFPEFYQFSCPQANDIVLSVLEKAIAKETRMAASLLRLHFHDCFVQLEEECPNTVSCADILALAARGSTVLSGGPNWVLPLGRRDSKSASLSASNNNIPAPNSTLQNLLTSFKRQGLDEVDLVALSGAILLGWRVCPRSGGDNNISPLDLASPARFDNTYFKLILLGKGLLTSDEVLLTGNVGNTVSLVKSYAEDENLFSEQFARSMVKMGNINPLTGFNGEVRKNCRRVN
ncbi:hypothetical protein FNV43_RR11545 [Rhamnella rubrinervis]|uniref:Peroxidase n=1 Tax=Rhamnella rubrinervis TaxID=2594499 RepID=A0A8K0H5Z1_9ROSA|nr:hypothetical protein FNV43_RR11545 [Rhamnella rubrinervis]